MLVVGIEDIDRKNLIHKYGADFLVALEMRNRLPNGAVADVRTIEIW
jgi:hypothetical protein